MRNGVDNMGQRANGQLRHPLRFVFFGESIVSDWGNPVATTVRAVMRALTAAGHEALFLEERRNRATVELLRARESSAVRAFAERYADLHYRTYDLPSGLERTVWFVRQVATVDAVVVMDGAPEGDSEEAARLDTRHLTRVYWSARSDPAAAPWAELWLSPEGARAPSRAVVCGPAVERQPVQPDLPRSGVLLVAYDDRETVEAARRALAGLDPECVSAGTVAGDEWPFVPEVALNERYRRARVAVVAGAGDDPFAAARELLPVAAGCPVVAAKDAVDRPGWVADMLARAPLEPVELPARYDAAVAAERLVEAVRQARLVRLS
ncbi:MAG TPA: hypothetical protein VKB09_08705 [Thermomicrobiales bacterium]|nr:hypothetical protein [Thermomicrobiales bacterium]